MFNTDLIVLSYHTFSNKETDYRFNRTYSQFAHDINKKVYDWITIDDGRDSMIKACEMMRQRNIRAKLFICTSLVGQLGYCTWAQLKELSLWHDIENHSHLHEWHGKQTLEWQFKSIDKAQRLIGENIGKKPKYFVPPYNDYTIYTKSICKDIGLILISGRVDILNISK